MAKTKGKQVPTVPRVFDALPGRRQEVRFERIIDRPLLLSELKREIAHLPVGAKGVICAAQILGSKVGWAIVSLACYDAEDETRLMTAYERNGGPVIETQEGKPKVYKTLDTLVAQLTSAIGSRGRLTLSLFDYRQSQTADERT